MMCNEPAPLPLVAETIATPLGAVLLVTDREDHVRAADFADCENRLRRLLDRRLGRSGYELARGSVPKAIETALEAYLSGDLSALGRIPLKTGGTAFQDAVWAALRSVEPGRPVTYAALAHRLGRAGSARAVGHANGANPICIVISCHRLIGADGALTGYSGGLARKRWLLDHEARYATRANGSVGR
jgi:methylated-DNA-[protein]-cysteine S-methyltransferase